MLKRNRKSQKLGSISQTSRTDGKVLTIVSTFFNTLMWLIITEIESILHPEIRSIAYSDKVACFKKQNEHENLHRNHANNCPLNPAADQQLKRVVVFCPVWW